MPKTSEEISTLKNFLSEDAFNKMKIAKFMGYTTTVAIDKWIARGNLPKIYKQNILRFIAKERLDGFSRKS